MNALFGSNDEWSTLREVVVGTPFHLDYHQDSSFQLFFHDNLGDRWNKKILEKHNFKPNNRLKDECIEDLAGFTQILDDAGVRVRRPETLESVPIVRTPGWEAPMGHALMPRDSFLVLGDEIIETPPMLRARYFETDLYKELLTEYFLNGARWTVAPRSRLLDRNFDHSYVHKDQVGTTAPVDPFYEIMFDAAQVARIGTDLVFNVSTENHRMGATWLQRHLGDTYRVHTVSVADNHIDAYVLPLRPGTLLIRRGVDVTQLPEFLQKWDMIWYEEFEVPVELESEGVPFLASQSIGINVLNLDEDRIVVQDIQGPLITSLEKAGFTPIPCRWRHGRSLGGGFHCVTLDTARDGELQSYA